MTGMDHWSMIFTSGLNPSKNQGCQDNSPMRGLSSTWQAQRWFIRAILFLKSLDRNLLTWLPEVDHWTHLHPCVLLLSPYFISQVMIVPLFKISRYFSLFISESREPLNYWEGIKEKEHYRGVEMYKFKHKQCSLNCAHLNANTSLLEHHLSEEW